MEDNEERWYVMRDLKRANAKLPAYRQLSEAGLEVFTPMRWRVTVRGGRRVREEAPLISDLLFVRSSRELLDPIAEATPTLQYRYLRGGGYREPMVVADAEMERFIRAVRATDSPRFFLPEELTPEMCGRTVRIVGGPLDGYEGRLLKIRGSRVRRLLVELPEFFSVGVEVSGADCISVL